MRRHFFCAELKETNYRIKTSGEPREIVTLATLKQDQVPSDPRIGEWEPSSARSTPLVPDRGGMYRYNSDQP